MNIFGIGCDIVQVARMARAFERFGMRFCEHILTPAEQAVLTTHTHPERLLAKRFAAKEAAAKALGTGFREGLSLKHIEVAHFDSGQPYLKFTGVAAELMKTQNINQHFLSISDERDYALAYVILTH